MSPFDPEIVSSHMFFCVGLSIWVFLLLMLFVSLSRRAKAARQKEFLAGLLFWEKSRRNDGN